MFPELEPGCGSWVIVDVATGLPVFETFERDTAKRVYDNAAPALEVMTAKQWLVRFNKKIKERA